MSYELGIIGAGNMAEAIARGVIEAGVFQPSQMLAADRSAERLDLFRNDLGIRTTDDNADVADRCRTLLLCIKPQQMAEVLAEIRPAVSGATLLISIAAGISSRFIEQTIGDDKPVRVIRVMPNTPMLVGAGVAAIAPGSRATSADLLAARGIFESAAAIIEVTEDQMDAVTAISGSGPAYLFYLAEQMIRAGIELGLPGGTARDLAARTLAGAAKMLTASADEPAELRRKVTSPGGTTEAAINRLAEDGWPKITVDAVKMAAQRSAELGR